MKGLRGAAVMCLIGAGLLLWALGRTWVRLEDVSGLTIRGVSDEVSGRDVATGALACAFVGLAAVVALIATRAWGRVLVGVLVVAAGVGALVDLVPLLSNDTLGRRVFRSLAQCDAGGCSARGSVKPTFSGWAWVAVCGAVLMVLAGAFVALRGRSWAGLSSSYEAPSAPPEASVTDKGVWDALDRGEDPTL